MVRTHASPADAAPGSRLPASAPPSSASPPSFYPPVLPGTHLVFPRDHGAHPAYRTEWWYLTGWLRRVDGARRGEPLGMQITFFRSRTRHDAANPSRFAPTQLLLAHAALAPPEHAHLLHAQRAARAGFGLAQASDTDTALSIGRWTLVRDADDRYRARIDDVQLSMALEFAPRTPPVAQGESGFSRKGPGEHQASLYYSRPQLRASGSVGLRGHETRVEGTAWLDHEWSSEILDRTADGWDWVGLNFDDGSALMAFRIRRREGGVLWSHARWIDAGGHPTFGDTAPDPLPNFTEVRSWTSPRTGARYPVAMTITLGTRTLTLEPLFDDQELDARGSAGTVYWEGAVRVFEERREIGRGYLELTGYAGALRF
ncbi:MAG: carotenoid 1,2-hydratase [Burkholderiaceae bacterium]|nr:carotenoid 1,2-hydratase [Burkholderiaceae bacterium]